MKINRNGFRALKRKSNGLSDIAKLEIKERHSNNTKVRVLDDLSIPKKIRRIFILENDNREIRGNHAHKKCEQTFWCANGSAKLICKDGVDEIAFQLTPDFGMIFVPNGIWVQIVMEENSKLVVLASRIFEEEDYLRDWKTYLKFRCLE